MILSGQSRRGQAGSALMATRATASFAICEDNAHFAIDEHNRASEIAPRLLWMIYNIEASTEILEPHSLNAGREQIVFVAGINDEEMLEPDVFGGLRH